MMTFETLIEGDERENGRRKVEGGERWRGRGEW